jgi:hypothetical protein
MQTNSKKNHLSAQEIGTKLFLHLILTHEIGVHLQFASFCLISPHPNALARGEEQLLTSLC